MIEMRENRANTKSEKEILRDKKQIVEDIMETYGIEYYYYRVGQQTYTNVDQARGKLVQTGTVSVIDADMFDADIRVFSPKKLFYTPKPKDFKAVAYGNVTYILYKENGKGVLKVVARGKQIDQTSIVQGVDLWDFSRAYQEQLISNMKQIKKK